MGKIVCPKCEKDDQIQKVTSIVTGGVSTTDYRNAYGGRETAVSVSSLASRLSLPSKPEIESWGKAYNGCACGSVFFGGIATFIIVSIGLVQMENAPFAFMVAAAIVAVLLAWYQSVYIKKMKTERIPAWEHKASKWVELYYCYRDDCVFDPKTNQYTSPGGMDRLL